MDDQGGVRAFGPAARQPMWILAALVGGVAVLGGLLNGVRDGGSLFTAQAGVGQRLSNLKGVEYLWPSLYLRGVLA